MASGKPSAALGQNVIGGVINEVNYISTVERSKRTPEGGDYDQTTFLLRIPMIARVTFHEERTVAG
jgi:hypothetical protein